VVSSDSAEGASNAPNMPWHARAAMSMPKLTAAPPTAEAAAGQERHLAAEQVGEAVAEQQQAAERQRVRGDHLLPVGGGEMQRLLRRRQRDVHDRDTEDHHRLGE
jgi:hypothetical protein